MISPNGFASADVARKAEADAKDADARRVAMINLHIAGHRLHGRNWNLLRGTYVLAASNGRTASSREATTAELVRATAMLNAALGERSVIHRHAARMASNMVAQLRREFGDTPWIADAEAHAMSAIVQSEWVDFWAAQKAEAAARDRETQVAREVDLSQAVYDEAGNLMFASPRY